MSTLSGSVKVQMLDEKGMDRGENRVLKKKHMTDPYIPTRAKVRLTAATQPTDRSPQGLCLPTDSP